MGNKEATLKREDLEKLQENTHYDREELKAIFKQFNMDAPTGVINKEMFRQTMRQIGVVDEFLQDLVFNAFDNNKDGEINFREFIAALSIMTRGKPDEKLEFTFSMYDLNGDGFISRDEMTNIMDAFFKLMGSLTTISGEKYESPADFVNSIFDEMDTNQDNKISIEEYKSGAMRNPDIVKGLRLVA